MQGPLGKGLGLNPQSSGTHVAFAAGTGVLTFIDLIARIALSRLNLVPDDHKLSEDFKLIMYASF